MPATARRLHGAEAPRSRAGARLVDAAERLDAAANALSDDPEPRGQAELLLERALRTGTDVGTPTGSQ